MTREEQLERLRENSKRYYEQHKQELSEKRKKARKNKLDSMTEEERAKQRKRNAEYQRRYRHEHPDKVARWVLTTWERKLNQLQKECADGKAEAEVDCVSNQDRV